MVKLRGRMAELHGVETEIKMTWAEESSLGEEYMQARTAEVYGGCI